MFFYEVTPKITDKSDKPEICVNGQKSAYQVCNSSWYNKISNVPGPFDHALQNKLLGDSKRVKAIRYTC